MKGHTVEHTTVSDEGLKFLGSKCVPTVIITFICDISPV